MIRVRDQELPLLLVAYLLAVIGLVALSLLPSQTEITFSFRGAAVGGGLIVGLVLGSNACRWLLAIIGFYTAAGMLLVQGVFPFDPGSIAWSALAFLATALLLMEPMRGYTDSARRQRISA